MEANVRINLCSKAKLDRDKGYSQLEAILNGSEERLVRQIEDGLLEMLSDSEAEWEVKHGALMGSKAVCESTQISDDFALAIGDKAIKLADDREFRVRIAAGEVVGALCKKMGPQVYEEYKTTILENISTNLEREPLMDGSLSELGDTERLIEKLSSSPRGEKRHSTEAAQIFHDTAGWKSLETWMKCLQCAIDGCLQKFNPYIDQELLDLIFRTLSHTNRFVRETGYYVLSSLVACGLSSEDSDSDMLDDSNAILRYGHQLADYLGRGLADNWSQVRLSSSVATRTFLKNLPSDSTREMFYPILLPRMCLNRYYVAEGVRIYSHDTWKQVTGEQGKLLVEKYIKQVVDYYIDASDADNHAVREAACACIAELGAKVSKEVMSDHIPQLLQALIVCFNDDSWPVRDAACVACGNFILCFPEESHSSLAALYPLFFNNLQDNIPSVRQGAALALANVVKAYGQPECEEIVKKIRQGLADVEIQPENTEKYSSLDKGPATYGVVKKMRDNDMELHTDRQMYSCGSLAPKMGRGPREGGCMDHKFRKEPEPWELADGCIHLVAELCGQSSYAGPVSELLPLVAKATSYQHYTHHTHMKETLCQRIPHMAKGLGKRYFKPHMELFFDAIFYSVVCDNALTAAAANNCLSELGNFLGPSILRGRVEQFNPRYLNLLGMEQGPPMFAAGGRMPGLSPMGAGLPPFGNPDLRSPFGPP